VLGDGEVELDRVVDVARRDIGVAVKFFQLVSSGFLGLPHRVADVREVVTYLGGDMIRNLVEGGVFTSLIDESGALPDGYVGSIHERARQASDAAAAAGGDAALGGLLHEVGLLALASRLPSELASVLEEAERTGESLEAVEVRAFGADHARMGAHLLALWGLPLPVVETVAAGSWREAA
jgi:HD-like signal output (HDOD) protein